MYVHDHGFSIASDLLGKCRDCIYSHITWLTWSLQEYSLICNVIYHSCTNLSDITCRFMLQPTSVVCQNLMATKQANEEKIKTQEVRISTSVRV